jgi:uncharacterized protein (TIGR02453 family)
MAPDAMTAVTKKTIAARKKAAAPKKAATPKKAAAAKKAAPKKAAAAEETASRRAAAPKKVVAAKKAAPKKAVAPQIEAFTGFPEQTFRFLAGIEKNNSREWLEAQKGDHDAYYVAPARAFVAAAGPKLREISHRIKFEPKVNGSLFRIQRDVRFSKDKTPYKTHVDLWFWEGDRRGWDSPGFFFRMFSDRLMIGAGMHRFEGEALDVYRKAVLDDELGPALVQAMKSINGAGSYEIGGLTRKTIPRGFDEEHPRAPLLLYEGLYAGIETSIPEEAGSAAFVEWCAARWRDVSPIEQWLVRVMGS